MAGAAELRSAANLQIDLSVTRKLEPNRLAGNVAAIGAHVVRFRSRMRGTSRSSIPCPRTRGARWPDCLPECSRANWKAFLTPELSRPAPTQLNVNAEVAWIEMPPGGWADGDYVDPGFPAGEHAYELDLKFAPNGKVSPLLSKPYPAETN